MAILSFYFVRSLRAEHTGIYVGSVDSQESHRLLDSNGNSIYAESSRGKGYLLFTSGTTLMGQVFDASKLQTEGEPFQVVQQLQITLASGLNRGNFSASRNGVLIYRTATDTPSSELVWFDRHGKRLWLVSDPSQLLRSSTLSGREKTRRFTRRRSEERKPGIYGFLISSTAPPRA